MKASSLMILGILIPVMMNAQPIGIKANAGTMGLGIEVVTPLQDNINVRAGGNLLYISYFYESDADDDFDLDAALDLISASALVDWYPLSNAFRLTGGFIYNGNRLSASLKPKKSYTVGGDIYTPEDLGDLDADFSFNPVAPYIALGFGNPFKGSRLGVNTDVGLFYQGAPDVSLRADGLLEPSADEAQTQQIKDNVSWARVYPVITFSLYYRLF